MCNLSNEKSIRWKYRYCTDDDGVTIDDVSQMVSLGNAEVLEVEYQNGKVTKLKVKSNTHTFTLCSDGNFGIDDEICPRNPDASITKLLNQYQEGATVGLVQDKTNSNIYYYVGGNDVVTNNHLWYGGHHWRVMKIDTTNNTLLLVSQQPLTAIHPASTVWDTEEEYETSYINNWLNEYFYNSLDSSIQNNILDNTFNVGIYTDVDEITTTGKVGLLDEDQYARAGGTNSYLDIKDYFWLGNRYSSSLVRYVYYDVLGSDPLETAYGCRPVIYLKSGTSALTFTGGNGTAESPYELQ